MKNTSYGTVFEFHLCIFSIYLSKFKVQADHINCYTYFKRSKFIKLLETLDLYTAICFLINLCIKYWTGFPQINNMNFLVLVVPLDDTKLRDLHLFGL